MNKYENSTNQQLIDEFNLIFENSKVSKSNINRYIKNHYSALYNEIEKRTIELNKFKEMRTTKNGKKLRDISIFERLYCLQHNLSDRPLCIECHRKYVAGFSKTMQSYASYCSQQCQNHSSIQVRKGLETKKLKYGADNVVNQKKAHQTRIKKYGSHHAKDFSAKVKRTKLKRHGDENYVNSEKFKTTIRKKLEENPSYYHDREQKSKQTKIENGHEPNWNNREKFKETISNFTDDKKKQIQETRKQNCLMAHGVEYPTQLESIKEKTRNTCLKKYGVTSTFSIQSSRINAKKAWRQKSWDFFQKMNYGVVPLISEDEFVNNLELISNYDPIKWKCKKCGYEFNQPWRNWNRKCPKCFPQNFRGKQNEVEEYIKSICFESQVKRDCKSVLANAKQLDIYVPNLNIAIEFNGLFWHNSDKGVHGKSAKTMMYHHDKSIECEQKGIRLIHIFEDEWTSNQKLCKSKLKKIISPSKMRHIDGHLCQISNSVDEMTKNIFLAKYSFDETDRSSKCYSLKFKNHVVAMMTFAKPRNKNGWQWQILNYLEVNSFIIDDGFQILFDAFVEENHAKSICLYATHDWNTKQSYNSCLSFIEEKDPRLYWMHGLNRIKSTSINASNVKSILKKYNDAASFLKNMNDNGYYRIYDSGTLVFGKSF